MLPQCVGTFRGVLRCTGVRQEPILKLCGGCSGHCGVMRGCTAAAMPLWGCGAHGCCARGALEGALGPL